MGLGGEKDYRIYGVSSRTKGGLIFGYTVLLRGHTTLVRNYFIIPSETLQYAWILHV